MADARAELVTLKLRAAKREGSAKITIIDHTGGSTQTCTITDGVTFLAQMVEKGKGHHVLHIVDFAAEKERKLKNPNKSTKKIFNCRTPEQWQEFNAAIEPYYEVAIDPHVAIDCIIKALTAFSADTIRDWVKSGFGAGPGPQPAEIPDLPDWLAEEPR